MTFRWLGVAGIELRCRDQTLLIDPFFTRFPFWRTWVGRVRPNRALIAEKIGRCDHILVTHPHWDHIMDVPDAALNTGAGVFGSRNACGLLAACGVPPEQTQQIAAGDTLRLGSFSVEVLAAQHVKTPIDRLINGPLPPNLKPPLRALDYRMDACFGFLIRVGEIHILVGPGENPEDAVPADVLFVGVAVTRGDTRTHFKSLLNRVRPKVVVPYHWDDFFRPLSKAVRPMPRPPAGAIPPLRRVNLEGFSSMIGEMTPGTRVLVPEMFRAYRLNQLF